MWVNVEDRYPEVETEVEIGYWEQDNWLKGKPWHFYRGFGVLVNTNSPYFKDGVQWLTGSLGCSHNQVQFWKYPEPPPERK